MRIKKKSGLLLITAIIIFLFTSILCLRPTFVWAYVCSSQEGQNGLTQLKIHQIAIDPKSAQPVVILTDPTEDRSLFIWIGAFEANAIHSEMQGIKHPRPLTHDLLEKVIQEANVKIQCVIITRLEEMIYIASIHMQIEGSPVEIDARPSDSMVIAMKFNAPIFVSENLFETMSVPRQPQSNIEEKYGLTAQNLTPSLAQAFSYDSTRGVLVSDVRKGSRAEKDGLRRGDIFLEVAGQHIENVMSMRNILGEVKHPVQVKIFRNANVINLTINPG